MEAFVMSIWRIIPDISMFYAILNIFIVFLKYQVKERIKKPALESRFF